MVKGQDQNRLDAPISDGPSGDSRNSVGRRNRGDTNTAVHRTTGGRCIPLCQTGHTHTRTPGDTNRAEARLGRCWEAAYTGVESQHWPTPDDPSGLSID